MPDSPGDSLMKGLDTGSTLFSRMMQPVLEREKQKQLADQFQQTQALEKQKMAHAALFDNLRRQVFQQQLLKLQHANDPNYEFNQFKNLMTMMGQGGGQAQQQQSEPMPDLFGGQSPNVNLIPKQTMGLNQDAFSKLMDSNANEMPKIPEVSTFSPTTGGGQQPQGFNFDALKQNPILRGYFKHKFGFDPLEQAPESPAEKRQAELDLFKAKEAFKNSNKGENTKAVMTKAQNTINGVDNALPVIDELIALNKKGDVPGQLFMSWLKRDRQSDYESKISESAETLANALGYPNTEGGFHQAEKVIARRMGESDSSYQNRLVNLKTRLLSRQKNARNIVKMGTLSSNAANAETANASEDDLQAIVDGDNE